MRIDIIQSQPSGAKRLDASRLETLSILGPCIVYMVFVVRPATASRKQQCSVRLIYERHIYIYLFALCEIMVLVCEIGQIGWASINLAKQTEIIITTGGSARDYNKSYLHIRWNTITSVLCYSVYLLTVDFAIGKTGVLWVANH